MFDFFWSRTASLWSAVLYIVFGVILAVFPTMSASVFIWALALGVIVYALSHLWRYYKGKKQDYPVNSHLALGILFILFGLFCMIKPKVILSFLPLTLGILLLLDGVGKLPVLMAVKKDTSVFFRPLLLSTIIPIILGIVLIANPFGVTKLVITFFGVSLAADGASDLAAFVYTRSKS